MKKIQTLLSIFLIFTSMALSKNEEFYSNTFGSDKNPAILFLHGGPGYNSFSFEYSVAQELANNGFYVIVFDQRGCGRTKTMESSNYTFEEAYSDIDLILNTYGVQKVTLMGHSWGGTLGLKYANKNPYRVENIILVDSPLSYQMSFKTILRRCRTILEEKKSPNLQYIAMLETMDTTLLEYSSYCFMNAMQCGLYQPKESTKDAKSIYEKLSKLPDAQYMSNMTNEPVVGFYTNEKYTTMDMTNLIQALEGKVNVYGIYGEEDGLFDEDQYNLFEELIGKENFTVVKGASHSVFIDQREKFLDLIKWYLSEEE